MRVKNDLPSKGVLNENFNAQWNTKRVPSSNQIG